MLKTKMKKSPLNPRSELEDNNGYQYDPQVDFSKFLEEARQHARGGNFQVSLPNAERAGNRRLVGEEKSKKLWRNSLLSWWKFDKLSKPKAEKACNSHISKPKQGHVSGPIYGCGSKVDSSRRRPTSGPIASLFIPMKRADNEMPYMCLDQLNGPHGVQSYGPVYFVT